MQFKAEYLGEDREVPGAKVYKVEAIHVTTSGNKRKYTQTEMQLGARSLSFRPLNRNHDHNRQLPYFTGSSLENTTLAMHFDSQKRGVKGEIRVKDEEVNKLIETGKIRKLSIEQIPTLGESCNEISCEQHGVTFIGLALLDEGITPGDPNAEIKLESVAKMESNEDTLDNLFVSDAQRECKECNDFIQCHECKHKTEKLEKDISSCLSKKDKPITDQDLAICLNECGLESVPDVWHWYHKFESWKTLE